MDKIPTLFVRDVARPQFVTETITPGCEWVLAGQGITTIKKDGTNVRATVSDGKLTLMEKRRNPSREEKAAGAEPGYVQIEPSDPSNKHILAAFEATDFTGWPDGAHPCEALGPKIQGGIESKVPTLYAFTIDPERLSASRPTTFEGIRFLLSGLNVEGLVWHHPDGRMAKIKRRDFGFKWPAEAPDAR